MKHQTPEVQLVGTRAKGGGFRVCAAGLGITDRPFGAGEVIAQLPFEGNERASRSGTLVTIYRHQETVITIDVASEAAADEFSGLINSLFQQEGKSFTRCIICSSEIETSDHLQDGHCFACGALLVSTRGNLLFDSQNPELEDYLSNLRRDRLGRKLGWWTSHLLGPLQQRATGYGEGIRNLATCRGPWDRLELLAITDHRILHSHSDEEWLYSRVLETNSQNLLGLRGIDLIVMSSQGAKEEKFFALIAPKDRFEEIAEFIQSRVATFRDAARVKERAVRERELRDAERKIATQQRRPEADHERMQGEEPRSWEELRQAVLRRDEYRCSNCGATGANVILEAHHIVPREAGGSDSMGNLVTLCRDCHVRAVTFRG